MKSKIEAMQQYLDTRQTECAALAQALFQDDRTDEANFEKIRANIYGVFRSVLDAGEKLANGNADKLETFFASRLESIPAGWKSAYAEAQAADDAEKLLVEQTKLEALNDIQTAWRCIWEETV